MTIFLQQILYAIHSQICAQLVVVAHFHNFSNQPEKFITTETRIVFGYVFLITFEGLNHIQWHTIGYLTFGMIATDQPTAYQFIDICQETDDSGSATIEVTREFADSNI